MRGGATAKYGTEHSSDGAVFEFSHIEAVHAKRDYIRKICGIGIDVASAFWDSFNIVELSERQLHGDERTKEGTCSSEDKG